MARAFTARAPPTDEQVVGTTAICRFLGRVRADAQLYGKTFSDAAQVRSEARSGGPLQVHCVVLQLG